MEIIIDSKKNNPLLSRTEVQFTIKHSGELTPNREIVRNELADKLNTKKENIIINNISSGFGTCETTGYAKVYSSLKKIKGVERMHFLKRNKLVSDKKKDDKQDEKVKEPAPAEDKPVETSESAKEETPAEPAQEEKSEEPAPAEDKPVETSESAKEETPAEPAQEEKKSEEPAAEDKSADSDDKKDANVEEEKKE